MRHKSTWTKLEIIIESPIQINLIFRSIRRLDCWLKIYAAQSNEQSLPKPHRMSVALNLADYEKGVDNDNSCKCYSFGVNALYNKRVVSGLLETDKYYSISSALKMKSLIFQVNDVPINERPRIRIYPIWRILVTFCSRFILNLLTDERRDAAS